MQKKNYIDNINNEIMLSCRGNILFPYLPKEKAVFLFPLSNNITLYVGSNKYLLNKNCTVLLNNVPCWEIESHLSSKIKILTITLSHNVTAIPSIFTIENLNLRHFITQNDIENSNIAAYNDLLEYFLQTYKNQSKNMPCNAMEKIKIFLDEEYSAPINLESLAQFSKINKFKIVRDFKSCFGETPMDYLAKIRLLNSVQLLANSNLTITEIAECCGYSTCSYYVQCFKKKYGMPPDAYRKQNLL